MVRGKAVRQFNLSELTEGQRTWIFLNQDCDYEERQRNLCLDCHRKSNERRCEVCGTELANVDAIRDREDVYRPGEDDLEKLKRLWASQRNGGELK